MHDEGEKHPTNPTPKKKQPILARSKGLERKLEDEKLDYKARKIMSAEKKALKEKGRVIPDFTTFEYEKRLRKVATRGVVKLFNAIRTQQKVTEVAVQNASETRKTLSAIEKAKNGKLCVCVLMVCVSHHFPCSSVHHVKVKLLGSFKDWTKINLSSTFYPLSFSFTHTINSLVNTIQFIFYSVICVAY